MSIFNGHGRTGLACGHALTIRSCLVAVIGWVAAIGLGWAGDLRFHPAGDGGFGFDTGELRGRLHAGGKSLGLQEVVHIPSGTRLDRVNGLLSHYRVFSKGRRYGSGAWDWASEAVLLGDGETVRVTWPRSADRPFELWSTYRFCDAVTVELRTYVRVYETLPGFESFVASYFSESFTNAAVGLRAGGGASDGRWIVAARDKGDWQMFPRDEKVIPILRDGRWRLEPNPVEWVLRDAFGATPLSMRRSATTDVCAVFMARPEDCFAISMPQEGEGHRSVYYSLFGRELKPGGTTMGIVRLSILRRPEEAWGRFAAAGKSWRKDDAGAAAVLP